MFRRTALTLTALAAASAVFAGPTSYAAPSGGPGGLSINSCVETRDLQGSQYDVSLCGVSDVDQQRAGLASNGGGYCGPASLFNVLDWWATRADTKIGWMTTDLRNVDPQDPADYMVTGNSIDRLATDALYKDGGTTLTNLRTAYSKATTAVRAAGGSTQAGVVDSSQVQDFGGELAKRLAIGPLQMIYGRYTPGPQFQSLTRSNGGHIVTVVSATGSFGGNTVTLELADPARASDHGQGNYLYTQSDYARLTVTLTRRVLNEWRPNADNPNTPQNESLQGSYRTITRWQLTGPDYVGSTIGLVEGFNWFRVTAG